LNASAGEARAWLDLKYETAFSPYYEGRQWTFPILPEVIEGLQSQFATAGSYPVDGRGVTYTMAFFSTKHSGIGQFYLMTIKDKAAQPFEGGSTYRLSVPVNVPVKQYWSATVYDRATHAFTREMHRAGRSSQSPGLQTNADGSVDIWFGPKSPVGKESNWIPTKPGGKCEVLFRFYGPEKSVFDKTWMLPDIELVAATDTAQTPSPSTATGVIPVTPDNFNRAETDMYFGGSVKTAGVGKFHHFREPTPLDQQNVIRMNRDTLYSLSVFDLDAGPVTITLPDAGQRFISLQVIDQDQYTPEVIYAPGSYTFTRDRVGTRYVTLGVRILANPADPQDLKQVHALQDAITVTQPGGPGRFEVPSWDQVSQKKVRDALLALAKTLPDTKRTFGPRDQVDPVRHLIGTAFAFGGNPEKDALYLNITPSKNDGATVHRLTVKDVPVDAFWSISVYNADGYFEKNPYNAYTLNGLTAKKNADGSFPIQFGACDGKILNCLPTMPGWNYMVRLYRPRAEILNGTWKFPEALPMEAGSRALQ
jgi:hypothetical protein